MNSLEHYRNQKWIIGVSGGPDSMALLDLAFRHGVNCVVVHVNYQKRDTAKRDQELVQLYCNKHNIECYVFNAIEFKGNFQDQAREYRYSRFKEVGILAKFSSTWLEKRSILFKFRLEKCQFISIS